MVSLLHFQLFEQPFQSAATFSALENQNLTSHVSASLELPIRHSELSYALSQFLF